MNAQAPISAPPSHREATADHIYRALCDYAAQDAVPVVAACDFILQRLQDRLPAPEFGAAAPFWNTARDDAANWAEVASDAQIAGMLTACLNRIGGARVMQRDREALLVALWNGLPTDRKQVFREKVAGQ